MGQKAGFHVAFVEPLESRTLLSSVAIDPMFAADGAAVQPFAPAGTIGAFPAADGGYFIVNYFSVSAAGVDPHYLGIGKLKSNGLPDRAFGKKGKTAYAFTNILPVA